MRVSRVALTGGIATGKSTVARMFAGFGAIILDADEIAREVVQPGESCWRLLHGLLGPDYFEPDGQLKRRKLRENIVGDKTCRSQVNAILHPAILSQMERRWMEAGKSGANSVIIFDIPLLFELELSHRFDTVILVYAPAEIQISRLMSRDGLSRIEAEKTLSFQLPIESKKTGAHFVIDNSLDPESTSRQVQAVWEELRKGRGEG